MLVSVPQVTRIGRGGTNKAQRQRALVLKVTIYTSTQTPRAEYYAEELLWAPAMTQVQMGWESAKQYLACKVQTMSVCIYEPAAASTVNGRSVKCVGGEDRCYLLSSKGDGSKWSVTPRQRTSHNSHYIQ